MITVSNPITAVTINGSSVPLTSLEWSATISHNREDITSPGQPSTANLTFVVEYPAAIPVAVSDDITIEANSQPRFTGSIKSMRLTHDETVSGVNPLTRVSVTAVGNLDRLDTYTDAGAGYTAGTLGDRASALLADTGIPYSINSDSALTLTAVAAGDPRTYRDVLQELCRTAGATMCDLPDGTILLETYTNRALNYDSTSWAYSSGAWSANTQAWQTARVPFEVPANAVYWAPEWTADISRVLNEVTVTYGSADPQATVTQTDAASAATYGTRSTVIETTIDSLAQATNRAGAVLTAQAQARWSMQAITIDLDQLGPADLTAALNLEAGDRVLLSQLPQTAPGTYYLGIVEGWREVISPDGHTLTVALSDPRYSYAMAQWSDVSGSLTWAATNATVTWANTVLVSDLT